MHRGRQQPGIFSLAEHEHRVPAGGAGHDLRLGDPGRLDHQRQRAGWLGAASAKGPGVPWPSTEGHCSLEALRQRVVGEDLHVPVSCDGDHP